MLLADTDIMEERRQGNIILDPFYPAYLQPASYDVHLDDVVLIPDEQPINPDNLFQYDDWKVRQPYKHIENLDPGRDQQKLERVRLYERDRTSLPKFWLPPGGVALGSTQELLTLNPDSKLAADIAGCSSLGRWWLAVHMTAGFIDPGWSGRLTLELMNASPWWLRIWAGMRIAQIRFYELRSKPQRSYLDTGHYAGAVTVLPSKYAA